MKFFKWSKDGGPESKVSGFFFVEIKSLFSIVLLKFENGSREAYHSHSFNSISWILKGKLKECFMKGTYLFHYPNVFPILTTRCTFHKVYSKGTTWVLSFRGPWSKTWYEYLPLEKKYITLTNGRKEVK